MLNPKLTELDRISTPINLDPKATFTEWVVNATLFEDPSFSKPNNTYLNVRDWKYNSGYEGYFTNLRYSRRKSGEFHLYKGRTLIKKFLTEIGLKMWVLKKIYENRKFNERTQRIEICIFPMQIEPEL